MYWLVRRELWENRSLYLAPLIVAAVVFVGFTFSTIGMPERRRAVLLLEPAKQRAAIIQPYDIAAVMLFATALIVGIFYCVDALYGERRDRSILFWKSLPLSDATTVLSKASIPLVVLPLFTFAVILGTQFLMMLWSSLVLLKSGLAGTTWTRVNLLHDAPIVFYGLIVIALWQAPVFGYLLLVSAWARRAPILLAVLPPFVIMGIEKLSLNSTHFAMFLRDRLVGGFDKAFAFKPDGTVDSLSQLTPGRFLGQPGLWLGLASATVFLASAVRLRRNREPI